MANKRIRTAIIASALIGCMAIGGISAYFTDADTAENTFTVGKVEIDLQEPSWEPDDVEDILPNDEIAKDPKVVNTGDNDAYIFVEVVVPYENVVTANDAGTRNTAADTPLFSYEINSGWVQVGTADKNTTDKTITYLYAYGTDSAMSAVTAGSETPTLFDTVKFANVVEDQNLEGEDAVMTVNAYAIQTTNVNGGKTAPIDVWTVLANQNAAGADFTKGTEDEQDVVQ